MQGSAVETQEDQERKLMNKWHSDPNYLKSNASESWNNLITKIYSNNHAFVALKADGSITAWGHSDWGGTGAPSGSGYTKIFSNETPVCPLPALPPHAAIEPSALRAAKEPLFE
jgi:hypothetical protein